MRKLTWVHTQVHCLSLIHISDEYAVRLQSLLSLYSTGPAQIEGGILGSVAPALTGRMLDRLSRLCRRTAYSSAVAAGSVYSLPQNISLS